MRFLHLIRPVMCVLPEVASPDRKVRSFLRQRLEEYEEREPLVSLDADILL
jgi:hypothetical protein